MKKILIVSDIYFKRLDSYTEFVCQLGNTCREKGVDMHHILPKVPCDAFLERSRDSGFKYTVFNNWWAKGFEKRHDILVAFRLCVYLTRERFDLVAFNFCNEITVAIVSLWLFLIRRKPVLVWHQHSVITGVGEKTPMKKYFNKLRMLSLMIDMICPVYKGQESILIDRGIEPAKLCTLYNGTLIHPDCTEQEVRQLKDELRISTGSKLVVAVGSLIPRKGFDVFLRAVSIVFQARPDTYYCIVGDGPLKDDLMKFAQEIGLAECVAFLGTRSDVHKILSASDMFVLSSHAESFGLVNIEAMAAGKPVIATRVDGIPEIVEHNVSGILVNPRDEQALADAMLALLGDEACARRMGDTGKRTVKEKFSIEAMVNGYCELYEKFMPRGSRED